MSLKTKITTKLNYEMFNELFPEESDCVYDSHSEAKERRRGINPMSEEYQRKVNLRRFAMGVAPYMGNVGVENEKLDDLISSYEYCIRNQDKYIK